MKKVSRHLTVGTSYQSKVVGASYGGSSPEYFLFDRVKLTPERVSKLVGIRGFRRVFEPYAP